MSFLFANISQVSFQVLLGLDTNVYVQQPVKDVSCMHSMT